MGSDAPSHLDLFRLSSPRESVEKHPIGHYRPLSRQSPAIWARATKGKNGARLCLFASPPAKSRRRPEQGGGPRQADASHRGNAKHLLACTREKRDKCRPGISRRSKITTRHMSHHVIDEEKGGWQAEAMHATPVLATMILCAHVLIYLFLCISARVVFMLCEIRIFGRNIIQASRGRLSSFSRGSAAFNWGLEEMALFFYPFPFSCFCIFHTNSCTIRRRQRIG